jgi:hypothetical protein
MAAMKLPRELVAHAKRMISRIFASFRHACVEEIGADDGVADPILALNWTGRRPIARLCAMAVHVRHTAPTVRRKKRGEGSAG